MHYRQVYGRQSTALHSLHLGAFASDLQQLAWAVDNQYNELARASDYPEQYLKELYAEFMCVSSSGVADSPAVAWKDLQPVP